MPGHNRGCPNRQSIGADAWHVLSQRNPANGVVRLYLSFPGEEFHIKRSWQAFHFRPDRHEILMTRPVLLLHDAAWKQHNGRILNGEP